MEKPEFNQVKYNNEFNKAHYDRFSLMLPKGQKECLKEHSKNFGYSSVNDFISKAIERQYQEDLNRNK